jgi:hypothetical protein
MFLTPFPQSPPCFLEAKMFRDRPTDGSPVARDPSAGLLYRVNNYGCGVVGAQVLVLVFVPTTDFYRYALRNASRVAVKAHAQSWLSD